MTVNVSLLPDSIFRSILIGSLIRRQFYGFRMTLKNKFFGFFRGQAFDVPIGIENMRLLFSVYGMGSGFVHDDRDWLLKRLIEHDRSRNRKHQIPPPELRAPEDLFHLGSKSFFLLLPRGFPDQIGDGPFGRQRSILSDRLIAQHSVDPIQMAVAFNCNGNVFRPNRPKKTIEKDKEKHAEHEEQENPTQPPENRGVNIELLLPVHRYFFLC
jgi:hypothetical protein